MPFLTVRLYAICSVCKLTLGDAQFSPCNVVEHLSWRAVGKSVLDRGCYPSDNHLAVCARITGTNRTHIILSLFLTFRMCLAVCWTNADFGGVAKRTRVRFIDPGFARLSKKGSLFVNVYRKAVGCMSSVIQLGTSLSCQCTDIYSITIGT
jgi:hypothetical protein